MMLIETLGQVLKEDVVGDMLKRVGFLNVTSALAYHDTQFDFPVGLC